ncbi:MAG: hypothetical protein CL678_16415 [Bdellovibrionaceae bacterium]|nr:hypothetical protein [Pseudobdellovibrionaceae bacterium]
MTHILPLHPHVVLAPATSTSPRATPAVQTGRTQELEENEPQGTTHSFDVTVWRPAARDRGCGGVEPLVQGKQDYSTLRGPPLDYKREEDEQEQRVCPQQAGSRSKSAGGAEHGAGSREDGVADEN